MVYKAFSVIFFVTTLVFAGLYFTSNNSEISATEVKIVSDSRTFKSEFKPFEADVKPESDKAQGNYDKPKVIIKEVSSHPEYVPDKIDDMAFVYETFLKGQTGRIKYSYPLLFERLSLDEDAKEQLSRLLSEKGMVDWMRGYGLDEDGKLELAERKEEMKAKFDQQIADLLGSELDIFQDYESKKKQYQQISSLKGKMEESGEFDMASQDELASIMQESLSMHKEMFKDDWKTLRESKEKADEFLAVTSERYKQMTESAVFLNAAQKEVFGNYLNKVYQRYEKAAKNYEKKRKSRK